MTAQEVAMTSQKISKKISIPREQLASFCQHNQIRKLSLFGSFLHGSAGPDSDLDLLVEFEPEAEVGFLDMARMERELTEMAGRRVDLRTPAELSRHFRDQVLQESQVQYAAAG